MNKALGDSWKKMQSAESQHEKEQHCKEFLSLFVRATFWLEYEERADDKGKPIGLIFTTAQEDNLGHLTFVYLGEGGEEPPALLSEVIAAGNRKFFPCDGASLLGIMHGAGCTVVVIAGEEEFIYLTQDIVAAFYSILVKRNGSKKSGGTNWLLVGLFSLFCLAALWGTYYWGKAWLPAPVHYTDIAWKTLETKFHNGDVSIAIPYNYKTDNWKRELIDEVGSGNVFRIYKSRDAFFRNHIINVGFVPQMGLFSQLAGSLDFIAEQIISSMNEKVVVNSKEKRLINGNNVLLIHGTLRGQGKRSLLTSAITNSYYGIIFVQIVSKTDDLAEHDYLSNKIINSINVKSGNGE